MTRVLRKTADALAYQVEGRWTAQDKTKTHKGERVVAAKAPV